MSSRLEISKWIEQLDEDRFRRLIYGFFINQGHLTYITHGRLEGGADIVLLMKSSEDILQRGQYFYFQVKAGKINTKIWRESLHSQLMELYDRPLNLANPINDDNVSKRMKALFQRHLITFNSKETVIELNGCHIESYPSHLLDINIYPSHNKQFYPYSLIICKHGQR